MNISEHLIRDYWVRRITPDNPCMYSHSGNARYREPFIREPGSSFAYLTQEDLMNETAPSAHEILSKFQSVRPVWMPTGDKNAKGKQKWVIDHYDEIETVSLGLPWSFSIKKASHFAGKGFWMANETKGNKELYENLLSWRDTVGLYTAYMDAVRSCFLTGDGAIYLYQKGDTIEYKVFSRLYGDMLYPDEDENRNPVLYREYTLKGKRAVDVFTTKSRETYVHVPEDEESGWLDRLKGWFGRIDGEKTEDGFRRVYREDAQVGDSLLQVTYFRVDDIPSGVASSSIRALERALSYVSEEVKSSAFPQLFIKAQKIATLPPIDAHGKVIGVMGDSETVKNADAKFLNPANASDIAELNINKLTENIIRTTMSVFIEPDILSAGSDSSTTIKIMFAPEIQWCQTMWPQFYHPVKNMVEVFKRLVGKVEGKITEYADLKISVGLDVWLPQNDAELIDNETKMVYAKVKSCDAARQDIGNQHLDDEKKIREEWAWELEAKAKIPAEVQAKYGTQAGSVSPSDGDGAEDDKTSANKNPQRQGVDNKARGQSVTR